MKFPILIAIFLFTTFYILHSTYYIPIVFAQTCSSTYPRVIQGLITTAPDSTNDSANKFGTDATGKCINSNQTSFAPFKIPSYADLFSLYYTQNHTATATKHDLPTGNKTETDIQFTDTGDSLYHVNGNLTLSGNNSGTHVGVVFVENILNINSNYCYGATSCSLTVPPSSSVGTVFVVNSHVNIDPAVTRIDAVIISSGTIYTAGAGCTIAGPVTASPLTIYGSLISLQQPTAANPNASYINFCRALPTTNNQDPAEKVIQQPKYLVILKDLFSDTLQKWSEIQ